MFIQIYFILGELVQPSSGASQIEIIPIETVTLPDLMSGNQTIQAVSLSETPEENQSLKEAADTQFMQETDNQSGGKNAQSMTVNTKNGAALVFSGGNGNF